VHLLPDAVNLLPDAVKPAAVNLLPEAVNLLPDAVKPGIQCVRTHWIRGFMAFHRVRRTRIVMLMVSA
jgi:hypothetical protein